MIAFPNLECMGNYNLQYAIELKSRFAENAKFGHEKVNSYLEVIFFRPIPGTHLFRIFEFGL